MDVHINLKSNCRVCVGMVIFLP